MILYDFEYHYKIDFIIKKSILILNLFNLII